MKERISGIEDTMQQMHTLVKENAKSKTFLTENIQAIWNTISPNLRKIGRKEREESQLKDPENIF